MAGTCDLTQGRVSTRLLGFFFPMLLTNALQQAYTFVDTIIVGKGLGDYALGSVGNLSSLMFLITGFLMGITTGFAVNIAQSFGAGDYSMLRKYIAHSIRLCTVLTVLMTVASLVFLKPLLVSMQTAPELLRGSLIYGYILFACLFVSVAYNLCSSILRALGDSVTPFRAIVVSAVANIVLDCVLIFGFHTGVEGAAIATVVAQLLSVLICLRKLMQTPMLHMKRDDFAKDRVIDRDLLKNGVPVALMNSITAIGCVVVQGSVNALGAAYTTAYSACSRYVNVFMLPAFTIGFAISAFVSQNKGAGKIQRIREGVRWGFIISVISWVLFASAMLFLPRLIAGIMLNEDQTISMAVDFLRICAAPLLGLNLIFVYRNAVQGMGHPIVPMCSGILEMLLRIPVIMLLIPRIGFTATAWADSTAWVGAFLINFVAYIVVMRKLPKTDEA